GLVLPPFKEESEGGPDGVRILKVKREGRRPPPSREDRADGEPIEDRSTLPGSQLANEAQPQTRQVLLHEEGGRWRALPGNSVRRLTYVHDLSPRLLRSCQAGARLHRRCLGPRTNA